VTVRSRLARVVMTASLVIATALALQQPANAASQFVGVDGAESRCRDHPTTLVCFYYNFFHQGYWGTAGDDPNLGNNTYFSGTGQGSGQVVRNNSRKMHCDFYVNLWCRSFYSPSYAGNYDWMYWEQVGELYFTWNDNASVRND
jgi:hypothetical protein